MRTTLLLAILLSLTACEGPIFTNQAPPMDPATRMMILSTMRANQPPVYQAPPMRQPVYCTSYNAGYSVQTNCY